MEGGHGTRIRTWQLRWLPILWSIWLRRPPSIVAEASVGSEVTLDVTYNAAMQPLVVVSVGGQPLRLVFDISSADTVVFVGEVGACFDTQSTGFKQTCYSYNKAEERGSVHTCKVACKLEDIHCIRGPECDCRFFLPSLDIGTAHPDILKIGGLRYLESCVEAVDDVEVIISSGGQQSMWPKMPVRLLVRQLITTSIIRPYPDAVTLRLFEGSGGILGASGPALSCRGDSVWAKLLRTVNASSFFLEFQSPPPATRPWMQPKLPVVGPAGGRAGGGRILIKGGDEAEHDKQLVWGQPNQIGDPTNDDGWHFFLMYHPTVCGVDLLYNTSSNWLTVLDTSGPCLSLPPFLFDRLRTHIPVSCPFPDGEASLGRLCSPKRHADPDAPAQAPPVVLPTLTFQLEDAKDLQPKVLHLPLERLAFRNETGHEFLCVARDENAAHSTPDMMFSYISFGSLAVSAFRVAVDLEAHRVGLEARGDPSAVSTDAFCSEPVTCESPMQTYFPPRNVCEDPYCSAYLFLVLDHTTKKCVWSPALRVLLGTLFLTLLVLDLMGHRLYTQAMAKARYDIEQRSL